MSISGEVTAPVVYAHSGNPEDYELLRKNGIDVKGKIVLVRYSNPYSYRGFKALTAQRLGAAAILIYSDPAEDGYKKGKVFPDGPWGPEYHIQRGAITYDFMVPGDPLTPGWASVPGAKRIPIEQAVSAPKIMALPAFLARRQAPARKHGRPARSRRLAGRPAHSISPWRRAVKVHLKVEMDNGTQPYYVVEGRIRGAEFPDEWVVLGNHRDAWEFGGVDPCSGTASMMEMTRALGQMASKASALAVRSSSAAGTAKRSDSPVPPNGANNSPKNSAPKLSLTSTSTTLRPARIFKARPSARSRPCWSKPRAPCRIRPAKLFTRPGRQRPRAKEGEGPIRPDEAGVGDATSPTPASAAARTTPCSSNFVGMPVIGLEFDGDYGVYHSAYDDFYWMNHFGDPGYQYHTLMSQLWGVTALRLANADLLPFDFASYASNIRQFVNELAKATTSEGQPLSTAQSSAARQSPLDLKPIRDDIDEFEAAGKKLNDSLHANSPPARSIPNSPPH